MNAIETAARDYFENVFPALQHNSGSLSLVNGAGERKRLISVRLLDTGLKLRSETSSRFEEDSPVVIHDPFESLLSAIDVKDFIRRQTPVTGELDLSIMGICTIFIQNLKRPS